MPLSAKNCGFRRPLSIVFNLLSVDPTTSNCCCFRSQSYLVRPPAARLPDLSCCSSAAMVCLCFLPPRLNQHNCGFSGRSSSVVHLASAAVFAAVSAIPVFSASLALAAAPAAEAACVIRHYPASILYITTAAMQPLGSSTDGPSSCWAIASSTADGEKSHNNHRHGNEYISPIFNTPTLFIVVGVLSPASSLW